MDHRCARHKKLVSGVIGEIDDDEYLRREGEIMQRLRDVRRWREEFGMSTSGGPVRVAGAEEDAGADEE